jgi:hypothetical protein
MPPKSPQPEIRLNCAHSGCCSHEVAEGKAPFDPEAGTFPVQPDPKGEVPGDSFKRYVLWSLAFFGIYASSSVCVF